MVRVGLVGFIIFFIFGAYLITNTLGLLSFPSFVANFDKWIYLISGILLIFGGFYFWREKRY